MFVKEKAFENVVWKMAASLFRPRYVEGNLHTLDIYWYNDSLLWHHNGRDDVSNHQPHECLINHSFRRRSKKTSKLRVTGLCAGNSPVTGEFPTQMAINAEIVSIWWHHHAYVRSGPPITKCNIARFYVHQGNRRVSTECHLWVALKTKLLL